MPRHQRRVDCDSGYADGHFFIPVKTADFTTGSGQVANRPGAAQVAVSLPTTATAYVAMIPIGSVLFRYGLQDDLQEQFGSTTAGGAQGLAVPPASFTTPAGVTGAPPFTGSSEFNPVTSARPKGILFKQITPVYTIAGAAATLNTIGLTKATYANNVAPSTANIIAVAANGMATATQANPYVTPIVVSAVNQVFQTTKFTEYVIEWDFTTGSGGTGLLFGVYVDVTFNFN